MDGYVQIGTKLDTKDFDAEIKYVESQLEEIEYKLKQADMGFEVGDTEKLEAQYSRLIKQLDKLQKKQADLNKTDLSGIQKSIENIGNSTGKTIGKLGRWALAIFSVRSAYGFLSRAMSTISQYNEQIATDVEYINFSLASILQPVIERLVQLAYKLLTYINYVAQQWFGVNLFANASAEAMNKTNKEAQKLQKTMAGFDEMNVIGDSGSSSSQGNVLPSFDLTKNNIEIPEWLKKVTDALDEIVKFATEHPEVIIAILGGAKLGSWIATILGVSGGTAGLYGIATALGIIVGIQIGQAIKDVIELKNQMKNNADAFEFATEKVREYKEAIKEEVDTNAFFIDSVNTLGDTFENATGPLANYFEEVGWWGLRIDILSGKFKNQKQLLEENLEQEKLYAEAMEIAYEKTDKTTEQTQAYIDYLEQYRDNLSQVNDKISKNSEVSGMMEDTISGNNKQISELDKKIAILKTNLHKTADGFKDTSKEAGISKDTLGQVKDIIGKIKSKKVTIDIDANGSKAETTIGNILNKLTSPLNTVFKNLGLNIKLPKLAVGGVINMPGRGINYASANIGERGAEGVIPLTNAQMMEQLGEAIGRYVTINANITNTMNGRVISRELKKVQNDIDFASNS